jgi:hypothetical protein
MKNKIYHFIRTRLEVGEIVLENIPLTTNDFKLRNFSVWKAPA